jgi:hypothetical protein
MRFAKSRIAIVLLVSVGLASSVEAGSTATHATTSTSAPVDQFIVQFRKTAPERGNVAARRSMLAATGQRTGTTLSHVRLTGIGASVVGVDRPLGAAEADAVLAALRANPHVLFAQPDRWIDSFAASLPAAREPARDASPTRGESMRSAPFGDGLPRPRLAAAPNDTLYPQQWNLFEAVAGINAPAAWDRSTGAGEVVAVLSTGITAHSDLAANLVAGYDFVSAEPYGGIGDGDGRDADPTDPNTCTTEGSYPGTAIAGVIAAQANNAKGIAGVAFDAKVQPIRVRSGCATRESDLADAIVWAAGGDVPGVPANATPARTLLLHVQPFTYTQCIQSISLAIRTANALGAAVVVGDRDATYSAPGDCAQTVMVSALSRAGQPTTVSEYDSDVAAPGGDATDPVTSTTNTGDGGLGTEAYGPAKGQLIAAAHVAGIAAMVQGLSPTPLPPAAVRDLLIRTSRYRGCDICTLVDAGSAANAAALKLLGIRAPALIEEGPGDRTVTFTVTLNRPSDAPVTFDFSTADGSALGGSDYEPVNQAGLTIPAGELSLAIDVVIHGDAVGEFAETFSATISNVDGAVAMGATTTALIQDDDGPVVLARGVEVTRYVGAGAFDYYRIDVPPNARGMSIYTFAGARTDVRYGALPTDATAIPCWYYSRYGFDYDVCSITVPEAGSYYIRVEGPGGYDLTAGYSDPATLSIGDASLNEGDGGTKLLTFTATLSDIFYSSDVTFEATTANGTASAGSDFVPLAGARFTIPAGQLSKTFSITVNGDTTIEPTEYFTVNLANLVHADPGDTQAVGYIINNDGPLIWINDVAVGEGNAGTKVMTFTVSLSKVAPGPVSYSIATAGGDASAGTDYQAINLANQVIPQGQLAKTHSIVINGDTDIEATEVLLVNVRQPTGASVWDGQGTGYILNDDGPTLSIPDASVGEGNSGSKVMDVTVKLSQVAAVPVTFSIASANISATAGSDYAGLNLTSQTIPAGELTKVFHVSVIGDTTVEQNEAFTVTLSNPTGATLYDRQAIATIYNDDGPTLSVNDVSISEGNSGTKVATFNVFLSQVASVPITFTAATSDVTASAGTDYVARSQSFQLAAGQLSKTFTVTLNGDTNAEANETFRVTLSNLSAGATLFKYIGTGTITNDD